jgi:hypothetical protein
MTLTVTFNTCSSLASIIQLIRAKFDPTQYVDVVEVIEYAETLGFTGSIGVNDDGEIYISSNGRYLLIFD